MALDRLRIGKISFLNLHPIFHVFEREFGAGPYDIIESYPSSLNRLLRDGSIDLSPSSSVVYLRGKDRFDYINGHSISSRGAVESILLFSRVPIESINGSEIYVTHQSETSTALLAVILRKFYKADCILKSTAAPFEEAIETHSAYMAIGDSALINGRMSKIIEDIPACCCKLVTIEHQAFYLYDLGELWRRHTGLPFVFALWIFNKDVISQRKSLYDGFVHDLDRSRDIALRSFNEIAAASRLPLPAGDAVTYWKRIEYGLPEDCLKGLDLFNEYLIELKLL